MIAPNWCRNVRTGALSAAHLIQTIKFKGILFSLYFWVGRGQFNLSFRPPTTACRCELKNRMQWNFNVHAFVHRGSSKVCDQRLEDADMAHNQGRNHLLFNIHNYRFKSFDKIFIRFSSGKPTEQARKNVSVLFQREAFEPTLKSEELTL